MKILNTISKTRRNKLLHINRHQISYWQTQATKGNHLSSPRRADFFNIRKACDYYFKSYFINREKGKQSLMIIIFSLPSLKLPLLLRGYLSYQFVISTWFAFTLKGQLHFFLYEEVIEFCMRLFNFNEFTLSK